MTFPNRKELEMNQMRSKVENEKNLVAQLQLMVKEFQVIIYQIPVCICSSILVDDWCSGDKCLAKVAITLANYRQKQERTLVEKVTWHSTDR